MPFWKRSKDPGARLRELVGDYELPSFSSTAVNILSLLRDENVRIDRIAEQLRADPGMHVKILRTVNSAAFGMLNRVTNLEHAVTLLGRSRIEALVLVVAVRGRTPVSSALNTDHFWQISALRACLAAAIGTHLKPGTVGEAFTPAFLQDMAIPVLFETVGERYIDLYRSWNEQPEIKLHEIEHAELGYDHAMVGAVMAESWELPEAMIESIADHHIEGGRSKEEIHAVSTLHDNSLDEGLTELQSWLATRLQMEPKSIAEMIAIGQEEARNIASIMRHGT